MIPLIDAVDIVDDPSLTDRHLAPALFPFNLLTVKNNRKYQKVLKYLQTAEIILVEIGIPNFTHWPKIIWQFV